MARIALIYGRDHDAKDVLKKSLQLMGHEVREFEDAKLALDAQTYNHLVISKLFDQVDAVLVAFTPDEEGMLLSSLRSSSSKDWIPAQRARPNVLLEYGIALGNKLKVIEVSFGFEHDEIPSDFSGLNMLSWSNGLTLTSDISARLKSLGIDSISFDRAAAQKIVYTAPEPDFDSAEPPYSFISLPFRLEEIELVSLPTEEAKKYKMAGYTIGPQYKAMKTAWQQDGWSPYIHKDIDQRKYVRVVFDSGQGHIKMFLVKKTD